MIFLVSFQFSPFSLLISEIKRFFILCWFLPGKTSEIFAHFLGFSTDFCNKVMSSSRVHSFLRIFLRISLIFSLKLLVYRRTQMIQPPFSAVAVFFEISCSDDHFIEFVRDFGPFYSNFFVFLARNTRIKQNRVIIPHYLQ